MTTTAEVRTKENFSIPSGTYLLGCPSLITAPNGEEPNTALYSEGVGEVDGHQYFTVRTMMDGSFQLFDTDELNHDGKPEHVDTFDTDIALLSLVPVALVPDVEAAEEHARYFAVDDGEEDSNGTIDITVHKNEKGHVLAVDVEWYRLIIRENL